MDLELGKRIIALRERVVSSFDADNWEEIGRLTGHSNLIDHHSRLLRSLYWGDEDYAGNALSVLKSIAQLDRDALATIERYLDERFPDASYFVSARPSERRITFAPAVFAVPDVKVESDLVAVMMPFRGEFERVYGAIREACDESSLKCLRADDIWEESVIAQDVFNLIFRARIVVVDFTGKNPNVMYETGIAHTLGKLVLPIAQSLDDVPFDMKHHRVLRYLPNTEGITELKSELVGRLRHVSA